MNIWGTSGWTLVTFKVAAYLMCNNETFFKNPWCDQLGDFIQKKSNDLSKVLCCCRSFQHNFCWLLFMLQLFNNTEAVELVSSADSQTKKSCRTNKLLFLLSIMTVCVYVCVCVCFRGWLLLYVSPKSLSCLQHENWFNTLTTGHRPLGEGWRFCGCLVMSRRTVCVLVVLWAMAHLSSPVYGLRALRRTTGGRRGLTGLMGQDAKGVPLRRSKRGWMWNQFFLLEEYTGSDMQYVGKVKTCNFGFFYVGGNETSTGKDVQIYKHLIQKFHCQKIEIVEGYNCSFDFFFF